MIKLICDKCGRTFTGRMDDINPDSIRQKDIHIVITSERSSGEPDQRAELSKHVELCYDCIKDLNSVYGSAAATSMIFINNWLYGKLDVSKAEEEQK